MSRSARDMSQGNAPDTRSEFRTVIAMAIPVVITTSSRALMDVTDYVMITFLGVGEAQAALLPAELVMWSYIVVGLGVVSMVNTFASQALGRGEPAECSRYAWQSLYVAAAFGVIAWLLSPFVPTLIALIGHDPKVRAMENAYLDVAMWTIGPTVAAGGLGWFFIGIHRPWVTMWSVVEANVVNVLVSFVLIFGHLGFEPMGIAGAAWGTLAGVSYRSLRLGLALMTPSMERRFQSRSGWRPSRSRLGRLLRAGTPCGLQWICEVVVWAIFVNVLVGRRFGTAHLIATNTAWQYMRIAFMPTLGVGQALTALVGKAIGAGTPQRAIRQARIAVILTFTYMGLLSVVYWLFGAQLIALFNDDADVVRIGATVMMCAAVFQLFDAVGITYSCALRGAGDTFVPSMWVIISHWVILIGGGSLVIAMAPQLGSLGPWLAASTLIVVTGVFLWWRWHRRAWMRINLFDGGASSDDVGRSESEATDVARAPS